MPPARAPSPNNGAIRSPSIASARGSEPSSPRCAFKAHSGDFRCARYCPIAQHHAFRRPPARRSPNRAAPAAGPAARRPPARAGSRLRRAEPRHARSRCIPRVEVKHAADARRIQGAKTFFGGAFTRARLRPAALRARYPTHQIKHPADARRMQGAKTFFGGAFTRARLRPAALRAPYPTHQIKHPADATRVQGARTSSVASIRRKRRLVATL
jgi:hypothetical protein